MKILYYPIISAAGLNSTQVGDYQTDTLFHGLRSLLGDDVIDGARMWHMYKTDKGEHPEVFEKLWGKGFTTYGLLPSDDNVDRDDIGTKIRKNYYDYIVAPIHHTENGNYEAIWSTLQTLTYHYSKEKIILVDGWDRPDIDSRFHNKCIYFKRELKYKHRQTIFPISFSIPEEKITTPLKKKFDFAPLVPNSSPEHNSSYIYNDEESYYNDYRQSYFAYTCKKGRKDFIDEAWDSMRHYEILACGCIPFFTDIEKCPQFTMRRFPKDLCIQAKKLVGVLPGTKETYNPSKTTYIGTAEEIHCGEKRGRIDFDKFDRQAYEDLNHLFMEHTRKYLTTISTAKYFLDKIKQWVSI